MLVGHESHGASHRGIGRVKWLVCGGLASVGLWSRPNGSAGADFEETAFAEEEQWSDSDPGEGWG